MDRHINLLQPDLLENQSGVGVFAKKGLFPAAITVIVLVFVGFYIQDQKRGAQLFTEVESIRRQRDELLHQIEKVPAVTKSVVKGVSSRLDPVRIDMILEERIPWSHILREFSLVIPKGTWITELENASGEGVRILGFAPSHKKVTEMMSFMETSRFFQDVTLEFSKQNLREGRFDFAIHSGVSREHSQSLEDG